MAICSIIIPAHNEERVIFRLLNKIVGHDAPFEVIVVCNGCNDGTADEVRKFGSEVMLLETKVASKTKSLQLGDSKASFWPRIYIDADVTLEADHLIRMVKTINDGCFSVVAPRVHNNLSESSWVVKSFYNIWCRLPYYKDGMIGSGVYCLSREGRTKFDVWPDIISDDGFVRALFDKSDRAVCETAVVNVHAPLNLKDLIKIKTRSRLGRYQLVQMFPDIIKNEQREKKYSTAFFKLAGNPRFWRDLTVYTTINLVTRLRATLQLRKLASYQWEKDVSTR